VKAPAEIHTNEMNLFFVKDMERKHSFELLQALHLLHSLNNVSTRSLPERGVP
jgi:hypothetical protein